MKEHIGVQMFTVRDFIGGHGPLYDSLVKIKNIGYDCVQMGTPPFLSPPEYKRMLDDTGLFTCCTAINYEQATTDPRPAIEEAEALGCRDLMFGDSIRDSLRTSEEGYRTFAAMLNRAGDTAGREGLRIHYHFHAMEFMRFAGGKTGMDILLERTNPDTVRFMPDTHWIQAGGREPSKYLETLSSRMSQVHCKDYAVEARVGPIEALHKLFAEVGEGNLDWPAIIRSCRQANVEYYIVEQDLTRRNPFDSIEISYKNLRNLGL